MDLMSGGDEERNMRQNINRKLGEIEMEDGGEGENERTTSDTIWT